MRGLALAALVSLPSLAATQPAPLCGRVIDAATSAPLPGAEVLVVGGADTVRTRTGSDGRWRLAAPQADEATVRLRHPGYAAVTRSARAAANGCLPVVALSPLPLALDAMVVTAARREQALKDAVVATEVVSRREIERTGASDVAAVLAEQTGIQLQGGVPAGAGVLLQGLGSERVLVLLDGQPLVGRVGGHFDISRLPTAALERIEVVKGPQSTLFGSEAMGGVINLVTRPPGDHLAGSLSVVGGSQGRRDLAASVTGGRGALSFAADAGSRHVDLAPGVASSTGTYADRWDAQLKGEWRASERVTAFAAAFGVIEDQRYRSGQLYQFSDNEQLAARAGAAFTLGAHRLQSLLYASRFEHLSRASTNPQPLAGTGERDVQDLAELELTYTGPALGTTVDAGLELRRERIEADRVEGGERSLDAAEPYVQLTWARGPVSVMPGARVTWNEQFGTHVSPRLAALWRPREELGVRASLGRGFRAPAFKELYLDFVNQSAGYAVIGNPDLRPETSTNVSLDVEWAAPRWFARASAFHNDFTDFIESLESGTPGTFTYGNVAEGTTTGVDVEGGVVLGPWRLDGGYGWLRARDEATGQALLGRPAHSGRLSAAYAFPFGLRTSVTALATGRTPTRRDAAGAVVERAAFTRLNARVVQELPGAVSLSVGVDNLLDEQPGRDWPGYTGRMVYAGLAWSPGQRP